MCGQQGCALIESGILAVRSDLQGARSQAMQDGEHSIHRAHDVRLGAAERGKTEHRKLLLQHPDIVLPEREIVQQVGGAFTPCGMHARKLLDEIGLELNQRSADVAQLGDQGFVRAGPNLVRFQFTGIVGQKVNLPRAWRNCAMLGTATSVPPILRSESTENHVFFR
ncbi:MAG TPA: hypothetical protein VKB84_07845 [Candidatus Binataceae bacterium]|nr:hypothetical protein [Candidatus Binataceae bacterium]